MASPPESGRVVVACAANGRYALPLAVMLRSALANLDPARRLEVHVVDDGIMPDDKSRVESSLTDRAALHWVEPRWTALFGLPLWGRMPVTTYNKLFIARFLPEGVGKAVWLDCDLVILGDVSRLYDLDLAGHHALAASDPFVPSFSSRFGVTGYEDLGLRGDAKYFNAGVMVIDVARWRRGDVESAALAYLERYGNRVFFHDQEALNASLAGKWGEIDERWNWGVSVDRLSRGREAPGFGHGSDPWILHFSGTLKPWAYRSGSVYHSIYYRYIDMTAWSGWRPKPTVRGRALGWYESSRLRRVFHPLERRYLQIVGRVTRRYFGSADR